MFLGKSLLSYGRWAVAAVWGLSPKEEDCSNSALWPGQCGGVFEHPPRNQEVSGSIQVRAYAQAQSTVRGRGYWRQRIDDVSIAFSPFLPLKINKKQNLKQQQQTALCPLFLGWRFNS